MSNKESMCWYQPNFGSRHNSPGVIRDSEIKRLEPALLWIAEMLGVTLKDLLAARSKDGRMDPFGPNANRPIFAHNLRLLIDDAYERAKKLCYFRVVQTVSGWHTEDYIDELRQDGYTRGRSNTRGVPGKDGVPALIDGQSAKVQTLHKSEAPESKRRP